MNQPAQLLAWMDALGDEARLRLLHLLGAQELGVIELCDVLQMPQSTVSRHLKVLAEQGFVASRRQGTTNLYRMIESELPDAQRSLWELTRAQSSDWLQLKQDELRLRRRLDDRRADPSAFFAGAAAEWDRIRREYYGSSFNTEAVLALLSGDETIADLGCGTGTTLAQIAPHVGRVIGIDSSPAMLAAARARVGSMRNVELREADLSKLPIETGTCDAAVLILALSYQPHPEPVLSEMARILRPRGRAVIVDLLPHDRHDFRRQMEQTWMGFAVDDVEQMMVSAGMSGCRVRPLAPEQDAKGPALFLATGRR
jgi:ArsR family transcriptional regulator